MSPDDLSAFMPAGWTGKLPPCLIQVSPEGELSTNGAPLIHPGILELIFASVHLEDGIYLLEGKDDAGEEFHTGLRIGPTNFGVDNLKRLRAVYPGLAGEPELRVKGEQNHQEGFYQLSRRERFDTGRGVQDRVMILDFHDFEKLSHIEIAPLVLSRR